jgi:two-component system, OmpR family, phosphate regulon sensor histidine kinase PhoR
LISRNYQKLPSKLIRRLIILGGLSIIGIIGMQLYWLLKTWNIKDKEFDQSVNIVLHKVADRMATYNKTVLPKTGLVQRRSSNTYAVNINNAIDASILEGYLREEMQKLSLDNFEYAVYNCSTDELVYGNFCSTSMDEEKIAKKNKNKLPKFKNLFYYFVVRFPERESFLLANKNLALTVATLSTLSILFFLYSIWVILEQKRLSELQKDFINNMTHEFKTPISSIKIASDYLATDSNISADHRLSKYTQIIREQNQRLNNQVEKVLNIARLEKDKLELKKETFELNLALKEIINNESLKFNTGNINFVSSKNPVYIHADKLHFVNVIANMIDNALKYSRELPIVQIEVATDSHDQLLIKVKDNGIGIDKESQRKLFDKFFRVSTGNVHNVKGFGLGLFYVKNICAAHKWHVDVSSELNQGSTFTITIPNHLTSI